ncbi:MAG: hypothetical protein AVDCRST_MAG56-2872 [uncultured Cytophagales bacterium]|uniref:Uncharacterized protein n=1 Tax=uncultured Cytophagales bacterium TaxID=158755 RepID=A0A6J4IXV3_9SPHI|nr:MAG: hypothetical protein AVDCRST_MAG56-2872 [uncultured Cytophagales bacterium]
MKPTKWQKIVSLVILAGVLMKLFDVTYGKEVFTAGFGGYLLMKLIALLGLRIRLWTALHYVQLTLILLAMTGLTFMYFEYPYSRVLFALALLSEGLVALRIKVNSMFGSQNVSNILRLISRMVLSRQSGGR